MRFLELQAEAMRSFSLPEHTSLGDHGENLSSLLQNICADSMRKKVFIQRVQTATPTTIRDFEFFTEPYTGKVLALIVEGSGQKISLPSASEGVLRLLALSAVLLDPTPAPFYFLEEIENGLCSSQLRLLMQLFESRAQEGIQIVVTTHSPYLLGLVSSETLKHISLSYRLKNQADARIKRIVDIPEIQKILKERNFTFLQAIEWVESNLDVLQ
jgi:predicted ATPase